MSYDDDICKHAAVLMEQGNLQQAENLLDEAIGKLQRKLKDKSDGQTVDDDWSEVGNDQTDDGDKTDDGDEEDGPPIKTKKGFRHTDGIYYPHGEESDLLHHQNLIPPSTTMHSPRGGGSYSTGSWPATRERTSFDDKVAEIMHRDGVSKWEAMSRARREDPQSFHSYQGTTVAKLGLPKHKPAEPDSDDQELQRSGRDKLRSHRTGRVRRHDQQVKKSYEQLISEECARGCNETVAAQRVLQAHGYRALDKRDSFIAKGLAASGVVEDRFYKAADDIIERDGLDSRMEGLRKARLENPKLFRALQSL